MTYNETLRNRQRILAANPDAILPPLPRNCKTCGSMRTPCQC